MRTAQTYILSLLLFVLASAVCAEKNTRTVCMVSSASPTAVWIYFSGASPAARWIYFSGPSPAADYVYVTRDNTDADIALLDGQPVSAEWVYISATASPAADWIYLSGAIPAADWIHITENKALAKYVICIPNEKNRDHRTIAILYHMLTKKKSDE